MNRFLYIHIIIFFTFSTKGQIVNYVNNGSFEKIVTGSNPPAAKYWNAIDSLKFYGKVFTTSVPPFNAPFSGSGYQWPYSGNNYFGTTIFYPSSGPIRGYPLNRLKGKLNQGVTYCVKFYCSITNQTSYGVDAIGTYFGDSQVDTISYCTQPLTYLSPQIQNQPSNILTDTLNWISITGTFVANGNEKYMIIGNFKSDVATNTLMINPANLPQVFCDVLIDDVSCIDINLPAFAGRDTIVLPGSNVFIGREPDVGIDEACIWYKWPNMTNPIDTVAGFWINPTSTSTYVVKQQLWCNNSPKWDTVIVKVDPTVGIIRSSSLENDLKIFPVPAKDYVELSFSNAELIKDFDSFLIYNIVGTLIREDKIHFEKKTASIKTDDLPSGVYYLKLKSLNNETVSKRFVISR